MIYKIKQRTHYALNTEMSLNNDPASNTVDNSPSVKYNIG